MGRRGAGPIVLVNSTRGGGGGGGGCGGGGRYPNGVTRTWRSRSAPTAVRWVWPGRGAHGPVCGSLGSLGSLGAWAQKPDRVSGPGPPGRSWPCLRIAQSLSNPRPCAVFRVSCRPVPVGASVSLVLAVAIPRLRCCSCTGSNNDDGSSACSPPVFLTALP